MNARDRVAIILASSLGASLVLLTVVTLVEEWRSPDAQVSDGLVNVLSLLAGGCISLLSTLAAHRGVGLNPYGRSRHLPEQ
jgi:hypothetical protein